jgi:sporulation protein YlmC with PRC-barrel domain
MGGEHVTDLLRASVKMRGIQLGRVTDVIFDRELQRAIGLEVHCGDEGRRFLPYATARLDDDVIELDSPFVLLDESELAFYKERATTFTSLAHRFVAVRGEGAGPLEDVVLAPNGSIDAVVVTTGSGARRIAYDDRVAIAERRFRAAS